MVNTERPRILRMLLGEALETSKGPMGRVGKLMRTGGIEAVCVWKVNEAKDAQWFSQPMVDLLVMIQGQLRVEFADTCLEPDVLNPGDVLVLPPETLCRAYRWPRDRQEATVFVAIHPSSGSSEPDPVIMHPGRRPASAGLSRDGDDRPSANTPCSAMSVIRWSGRRYCESVTHCKGTCCQVAF
jgi:hypothetical protein